MWWQTSHLGWVRPSRMVSPSIGLLIDMPQVAPTSKRPVYNELQQQIALICVTSSRSPSLGSGCNQPTLGGSGPECLSNILGKVVAKFRDYPCRRITLIAPGRPSMPWFQDLVGMSSQIPLYLPNLLTQPFKQIPHRNLSNLHLHAWLLEPRLSKTKVSLRQWQHKLRLLKETHPDQSLSKMDHICKVVPQ